MFNAEENDGGESIGAKMFLGPQAGSLHVHLAGIRAKDFVEAVGLGVKLGTLADLDVDFVVAGDFHRRGQIVIFLGVAGSFQVIRKVNSSEWKVRRVRKHMTPPVK